MQLFGGVCSKDCLFCSGVSPPTVFVFAGQYSRWDLLALFSSKGKPELGILC